MLLLYYSSSFTSKMLLMGRALLAQLCPLNLPPLRQGQLCTLASSYMKTVLIFALASALPSVAGFGGISFALRDDAQGRVFLGHGCVSSCGCKLRRQPITSTSGYSEATKRICHYRSQKA